MRDTPTIVLPSGRPARDEYPDTPRNRYEAAQYSPQRASLFSGIQDADQDVDKWSRERVLEKARYLYRNSPFIHGLVERLVTYVVGTGLYPSPSTSDQTWNKKASAVFRSWSRFCELEGLSTFSQYQRKAFRAKLVDGEAFTSLTYGSSGRNRVQLFESHRCKQKFQSESEADGISLDKYGRPTGYRIGDSLLTPEQVVHHFTQERASQHRGISILASAINTAQDVTEILGLEKAAVKEGSSKTDIIKTGTGEMDQSA
jgi:capsid protein